MKVFSATLLVLVLAFFAIKSMQTPTVPAQRGGPRQLVAEDMTQFSIDLAKFMKDVAVKDGAPSDDLDISAKCKPNQGAYHTRCWITITELTTGKADKATAENVRRRGNGFVWDHES